MAKEDIGGVWRTVGGRRIFIKDGEDLETAMKNSGKFGKKKDEEFKPKAVGSKKFSEYDLEMTNDEAEKFSDYLRNKYGTDDLRISAYDDKRNAQKIYNEFKDAKETYEKATKEWINSPFGDDEERARREKAKNEARNNLYGKPARNMEESNAKKLREEYNEYVRRNLENDDYLRENNPNAYFYKMIEETEKKKESYDPYKGTKFERKYDSVKEALDDPNGAFQEYLRKKEQKKKNK